MSENGCFNPGSASCPAPASHWPPDWPGLTTFSRRQSLLNPAQVVDGFPQVQDWAGLFDRNLAKSAPCAWSGAVVILRVRRLGWAPGGSPDETQLWVIRNKQQRCVCHRYFPAKMQIPTSGRFLSQKPIWFHAWSFGHHAHLFSSLRASQA